MAEQWSDELLGIRRGNYRAFLEESGYGEEYIVKALGNFDAKETEMDDKENPSDEFVNKLTDSDFMWFIDDLNHQWELAVIKAQFAYRRKAGTDNLWEPVLKKEIMHE